MSESELKGIEKRIASELDEYVKPLYSMAGASRSFKIFEMGCLSFNREYERTRVIRKYIAQGLLQKTTDVKDTLQWLYLYLGVVETLGNAIANALIMLLAANGIHFHVEYQRITPRIKHATSIDDLTEEFTPLKTKLNFLKDNKIVELSCLVDTKLRNDIAHLRIKVKDSEIYIRGKNAKELIPQSTVKLLRACNTARDILQKVAKDRGILGEGVEP